MTIVLPLIPVPPPPGGNEKQGPKLGGLEFEINGVRGLAVLDSGSLRDRATIPPSVARSISQKSILEHLACSSCGKGEWVWYTDVPVDL